MKIINALLQWFTLRTERFFTILGKTFKMEAPNYRPGNIVFYSEKEYVIQRGEEQQTANFKPIKLDDKWFGEFGFKNQSDVNYFKWQLARPGEDVIDILTRKNSNKPYKIMSNKINGEFNYVHELQNMYHESYRKELIRTSKKN